MFRIISSSYILFSLRVTVPLPPPLPPPRFKDNKSKSFLLSLGEDLAKAESSLKFKTICFKVRPVYICFFFLFPTSLKTKKRLTKLLKVKDLRKS